MEISAYLTRIGYDGSLEPTVETLTAIHRRHLLAIPYENLDIHLGRRLTLDTAQMYEKMVTRQRGGWCFEMNGLLAWALRELGFSVTLLSSNVGDTVGTHLILLVELDRPYLVDVGFGNGLLEPIPLEVGSYQQGFLGYGLEHEGRRWQFINQPYGGDGFSFVLEPCQLSDFAEKCHELQTSPDSGFVRTTVCHGFTPESQLSLRGAVLSTATHAGQRQDTIESEEEYDQVLREQFHLHLPAGEVATLWEKVRERHLEWLKTRV